MSNTTNTHMKTEWDLKSLFYTSLKDPNIEKDIAMAEKAYTVFEKKYRKNASYLKSDTALVLALKEYEKLVDINLYKPYTYLHFILDTDSKNEEARSLSNLIQQRLISIGSKIMFFGINLSKVDKATQKKFLASKKLARYTYFLKKTFELAKHTLTEQEEKILSLKTLTSHTMWVDNTQKTLNKMTVKHLGKDIPLSSVNSTIMKIKTQKGRTELQKKYSTALASVADMATMELNAIVTDKKIEDELRGYKNPFDETVMSYENDPKTVETLVKAVSDNFHIAHRFYRIKAKMLKLSRLQYADRLAEVGNINKKYSFADSYKILSEVFGKANPKWKEILETYVQKGQIDVFPRIGKRSGAYSAGGDRNPTMVLLNHTDDFHSLNTFAHEMGHSVHTELSMEHPVVFYRNYTISTAEVASTLFESFLFYNELEKMSEKEQTIALHDNIEDAVSTIFRQISLFNFEVEMHTLLREKGSMSTEDLRDLMLKHNKAGFGDMFDFIPEDGLAFVSWPHIRYFFYVYTYAMGSLTSRAIYAKYKKDPSYMEKITTFMSLGGSMSPEDIFKSIGVDIRKPDFFLDGLRGIEADIERLEKLVNTG